MTTETIPLARGQKGLDPERPEVSDERIRGLPGLELRRDQPVHDVMVRRIFRTPKTHHRRGLDASGLFRVLIRTLHPLDLYPSLVLHRFFPENTP